VDALDIFLAWSMAREAARPGSARVVERRRSIRKTNHDRLGKTQRVLVTISTTHAPATDLGFLLHKHPGRVQSFDQSAGVAHVFYPEATAQRCTAALLLEVDPIGLVRGRKGPSGEGFALGQ
jgi:hypothetical protein